MKFILAEKPSVAKNIADALYIKQRQDGFFEGNGYIISWAFGHLLQLYDAKDYDPKMTKWQMENFPFMPEHFRYKVKMDAKKRGKEDAGARKQLQIIQRLINRSDVQMIISACDFDREGQIIGDSIIYQLNRQKPVYRLLLNEWTADEVRKGLATIKPNSELKPLQDAGVSRQWADWLIGINLTSVATLKYQQGTGKALNIGRVLLPTLKIIYDRDQEIERFVPEDYFKLAAQFSTEDGRAYEGIYYENKVDRFKNREDLERIEQALDQQQAMIVDKKVERKKEYPPMLFNLSNLQGFITSKYKGWTSDKVLKVAQTLYEKKYITYPRTASVVLEESLVEKTANVLERLKAGLPYEHEIQFTKNKRIFDNAKVESHSAIIPTYVLPKSLATDEAIVYQAIKNRFMMQFMPVAEYEETRITTKVQEIPGIFATKGRVQLVEGWKKVEAIASTDIILPLVHVNEPVHITEHQITKHVTTPPKRHSEKTLLRVMETCGKGVDDPDTMAAILSGYSIGTPATRAETIKKLLTVGYITMDNKSLVCTELGRNLVETFPVKDLFDLEFTGRLEKTLADIEKRRYSKEQFLQFICQFTVQAVETIKSSEDVTLNKVTHTKKKFEAVGKCPLCSHQVIEGHKGFGCSNWKNGCQFVIWKNDKFLAALKKKPTKTMVKALLTKGTVLVKGLTSKKGQKFDAYLQYTKNADNDYFSWQMHFPDKNQ
ncbi:type IA DNA topoisomerase [Lysinibacillus macroides]|uniref:DNA topoisomerase n=1 Tax=Lysinibacillus macroides TaxID=33935 RepID=A0A0M9DH85_9BACI|nr:type IA DNA topoisomerase [Lysinibacillus macroides]KOY80553.1 DNA topoisomerase [Lysinibacillus macroides]QPR69685.1 type IA DNA topoisomerase [Lysinibacillus macroides]